METVSGNTSSSDPPAPAATPTPAAAPNPALSPSDDPSSQFFLHPSDNPGAKVILEVLDGSNYTSWSKSVLMALAVKHKSGFVDGSISPPSNLNSVLYTAWFRANSLVLSWILNSINSDIRSSLLYFTSARDVWEELRIRFVKSDRPRVFHLEKSLSSLSQANLSITAYYNMFKGLWDEYVNFRSIPRCSCGYFNHCTCQILQTLSDRQQSDAVLKFLIGLNDSFISVRSQILLMSPIPPLNKVYSLLLQEESQRNLTKPDDFFALESVACLAKQPVKERKRPTCDHCGYSGHTIDKCYQIIGYPPNWKGPKGPRKNPNSQDSQKSSKANAVTANSETGKSPTLDLFSPEMYNQFLSFAKSQASKDSSQNHSAAVALAQSENDVPSSSGSKNEYCDWIC